MHAFSTIKIWRSILPICNLLVVKGGAANHRRTFLGNFNLSCRSVSMGAWDTFAIDESREDGGMVDV